MLETIVPTGYMCRSLMTTSPSGGRRNGGRSCSEGTSGSERIRQTERAPAFPTEVRALFIFGTKRDKI